MMRPFRLAVIFVILILAVFGYFVFMPVQSQIKEQEATTAPSKVSEFFDHSKCQYPDRTTNPIDGCDNSDPCDPASAAKGGSGECAPVESTVNQPVMEGK